jgi:hypothetical protein
MSDFATLLYLIALKKGGEEMSKKCFHCGKELGNEIGVETYSGKVLHQECYDNMEFKCIHFDGGGCLCISEGRMSCGCDQDPICGDYEEVDE